MPLPDLKQTGYMGWQPFSLAYYCDQHDGLLLGGRVGAVSVDEPAYSGVYQHARFFDYRIFGRIHHFFQFFLGFSFSLFPRFNWTICIICWIIRISFLKCRIFRGIGCGVLLPWVIKLTCLTAIR